MSSPRIPDQLFADYPGATAYFPDGWIQEWAGHTIVVTPNVDGGPGDFTIGIYAGDDWINAGDPVDEVYTDVAAEDLLAAVDWITEVAVWE